MSRKSTEQLEAICDEAERAYWKASQALPEWKAWQKAERLKQKDHHDLRKAFYRKVDHLPEWLAYENAWLALQRRHDV